MKKILSLFVLFLTVGLLFGHVQAQGNGISRENRAVSVSNDCWRPFMEQHSYVEASLYAQGTCTNGGAPDTYAVYVVYQCAPNVAQFCRPAPPRLAAYVTYDCGNGYTVVCVP